MPPAGGTALAAAVRMIDRVHGYAAVVRHAPHPALAPGLADRDVHVVRVGHRADRRHAAAVNEALLGRIEPQDHVFAVAADDLGIGPGRARDLAALADLDLDIVHDGANRNVADRHGVARLDVDVLAGDHGVARGEPLRRQDIGKLAVLVLDQRDEAGAVGIVFDALDLGRHVEFAALEIELAVGLLVAAAAETHGDASAVVAPAARALAFGQGLHRRAAMEAGAIDQDELALARRDRIVGFECHGAVPLQTRGHVDAVTLFEGHHRALDFRLLAHRPLERLDLALADVGVDALDLDVEQLLHRLLDLRLGRVPGDLEHHLAALGAEGCLLGDDRREDRKSTRLNSSHLGI